MTDTKIGKPDRDRINVSESYELRSWAQYFGVTETKIREVVTKVGPTVAAVKTYLANETRNER